MHPTLDASLIFRSGLAHEHSARNLRAQLERGGNLTFTIVGASSSVFIPSYGTIAEAILRHQLPEATREHIVLHNAAQGFSSPSWASAFLNAIIHPATDVLIWEFITNDNYFFDEDAACGAPQCVSPTNGTALALARFRTQIDLFVRRALAFDHRIALCFVFIWRHNARACYPHCPQDTLPFRTAVEFLKQHYAPHVDILALDYNALAKTRFPNASLMFHDMHHMIPAAQEHLGATLADLWSDYLPSTRAAATSLSPPPPLPSPQSSDPSLSANDDRQRSQSPPWLKQLANPYAATCDNATSHDECALLRRLFEPRHHMHSIEYNMPTFGVQTLHPLSDSSLPSAAIMIGKAADNRIDRKFFVDAVSCRAPTSATTANASREGRGLVYAAHLHTTLGAGHDRYVGINACAAPCRRFDIVPSEADLHRALHVTYIEAAPVAEDAHEESWVPTTVMPVSRSFPLNPPTVGDAIAPQAWFVLRGVSAATLKLRICTNANAYRVSGVVLV